MDAGTQHLLLSRLFKKKAFAIIPMRDVTPVT
jgi:hypothetical protein